MRAFPRSEPSQTRGASFGQNMRAAFARPGAPALEVRDLSFGPIAVAELRCDAEDYGSSVPLLQQDAVMVSLQLATNAKHEVWEDGKLLPLMPLMHGMTRYFDMRRAVTARSMQPFHCLNFAIPLRSFDEATGELVHVFEPAAERLGLHDPVIDGLGRALLPTLGHAEAASRLFVDHVLFALRAHIAHRCGAPVERRPLRGGLASWQEHRAKAFIDGRLTDSISLADLARECSLSVAQFARAFKRTTGVPPHQFLTERRIQRARSLLLLTDLPLADVAIRCGFADQSHFTKAFRRVVGVSPGSFRSGSRKFR